MCYTNKFAQVPGAGAVYKNKLNLIQRKEAQNGSV